VAQGAPRPARETGAISLHRIRSIESPSRLKGQSGATVAPNSSIVIVEGKVGGRAISPTPSTSILGTSNSVPHRTALRGVIDERRRGQRKSQFLLLGSASIDLIGRHRNRWPADSRRERHLQYLGTAAPFFLTPHLASNSDICSLFVRSSPRQGAVIEDAVRCTGRTPVRSGTGKLTQTHFPNSK
jgi:hypothetical protein